MILISAVYPNETDSRFDPRYYLEQHEPFASGLLSAHGLTAIRTTIGLSALDGSPPAFWAISEMSFSSRADFDEAMARCGEQLFADIPHYTDVTPTLQVSELGDETKQRQEPEDGRHTARHDDAVHPQHDGRHRHGDRAR